MEVAGTVGESVTSLGMIVNYAAQYELEGPIKIEGKSKNGRWILIAETDDGTEYVTVQASELI